MNILIVEDNPNEREILRFTLERHGCMVIEAADGLEGLDLAIHRQPDIIVSNTLMPRMDGFQLLWALKADPKLTSIPFLFYSDTFTGEQEEKLAISLGAAAFIVKNKAPESVWLQADAAITATSKPQKTIVYPTIDKSDRKHLREYGRIVATKLEEKVRELQAALTERRQVVDEIKTLKSELAIRASEFKRAEDTIKEQEQQLSNFFEVAPFPLLLLDGELRIRRINKHGCSLTGSPAIDMLGLRSGEALRCIHALDTPEGCGFGPNCRECLLRICIKNCLNSEQQYSCKEVSLPLSAKDSETNLTFILSISRATTGKQDMLLITLQDITAQKTLERKLHYAQKMEAAGILAGGIAHECNSHLSTIVGYGNTTLMSMSRNDPNRQNVEQIVTNAKKAAHLTNKLKIFCRKQSGEKKNINLNETILSMQNNLLRLFGQDINCTTLISDQELTVCADKHHLELLLTCLINKILDTTQRGGSLTITTDQTRLGPDVCAINDLKTRNSYALLTVTHSNASMGSDDLEHIFNPLFSIQEQSKWPELQLSLISHIIKQHESHITVFSEPGKGTAFRIYIPLVSSTATDRDKALENEKSGKGGETILLAEDDEAVRNMAEAILQHFGYEVIVAVDGEDAVQKYLKHAERINLLLFDLVMPKMSGQEAYVEIKKHAPNIKVVFASGHTPEIIKQRKLVDENALLIFKPYLPSVFLQKVRSALDSITL
ncbi:response regulator [Pelobacter propionicus]|uniref:Histidine kinase n=1 Tax=Pelobacter propionicus (strain DSM 2379 / NBRC 103807 / OttBd1) TaxID=338966 RepID=A1ASD6_PELPD|nr:response regulator [Pelobacter propionicus]ABL00257.1 histidine kinase [Pelobacter propionicus DSM 2379]